MPKSCSKCGTHYIGNDCPGCLRAQVEELEESLGWALQLIDSVCGVGESDRAAFDKACATLAESGFVFGVESANSNGSDLAECGEVA